MRFPRPQDNWLLDVFLYSEQFSADYLSLLFEELGIPDSRPMRDYARKMDVFFRSKERRARLKALAPRYEDVKALRAGVFSAALGLKTADLAGAVREILLRELMGEGGAVDLLHKFTHDGAFWEAVSEEYGFTAREEPLLLATHLLCSAAVLRLDPAPFQGLPFSLAHAAACHQFFTQWLAAGRDSLLSLCLLAEARNGLAERLRDAEDLVSCGVFPCADQLLLSRPLTAFARGSLRPDEAEELLRARAEKPWASLAKPYYDAIRELCAMQVFRNTWQEGFRFAAAEDLWKSYTRHLHQMDRAYRRFHLAYDEALHAGLILLEDALKEAAAQAENLYKGWFLEELSAKWSALLEPRLAPGWRLNLVPEQKSFYSDNVRAAEQAGRRLVVIVSDALRYEVAAELSEALNSSLAGTADCQAMQGIFPGITALGMAALLPQTGLTLDDRLEVLANGLPTNMPRREAVLQAANPDNAAIGYETLIEMNREQRARFFKGKKAVYIYHNAIDAAGDHAPTERKVFEACRDAIHQLTSLVRSLANEQAAATVLITADHGFLYTAAALNEWDKAPADLVRGEVLVQKRRYAIARKEEPSDQVLNLPLDSLGRPDLLAVSPRDCLRFKVPGPGVNYVHGGLSLQELVIPVVRYQNKRAGQKGYQPSSKVTLRLTAEGRTISNNIFSLPFIQEDAVTEKVLSRVVTAHFEDANGELISDIIRLVADRDSENPQERFFRPTFHLTQRQTSRESRYFLVLRDEEDQVALERIPFTIDIAFGLDIGF